MGPAALRGSVGERRHARRRGWGAGRPAAWRAPATCLAAHQPRAATAAGSASTPAPVGDGWVAAGEAAAILNCGPAACSGTTHPRLHPSGSPITAVTMCAAAVDVLPAGGQRGARARGRTLVRAAAASSSSGCPGALTIAAKSALPPRNTRAPVLRGSPLSADPGRPSPVTSAADADGPEEPQPAQHQRRRVMPPAAAPLSAPWDEGSLLMDDPLASRAMLPAGCSIRMQGRHQHQMAAEGQTAAAAAAGGSTSSLAASGPRMQAGVCVPPASCLPQLLAPSGELRAVVKRAACPGSMPTASKQTTDDREVGSGAASATQFFRDEEPPAGGTEALVPPAARSQASVRCTIFAQKLQTQVLVSRRESISTKGMAVADESR